jgi:ribosomal protein S18 acetylase RimI-like enzyme
MRGLKVTTGNGDPADLHAFLDDRSRAFNAAVTGVVDEAPLHAEVRDAAGAIIGGVTGYTWGGCCKIAMLWVHEDHRRLGVGRALMEAAEAEAVRRGCRLVTLSTHTFQAPGFYARLGYEQAATIADYPVGHAKIYFVKRLAA